MKKTAQIKAIDKSVVLKGTQFDRKRKLTDEQVQEQIDSFNEQIKNDEDYQKELKKMGIDEDFLKYQFSRDLANSNLQAKFEDDIKISESEMKKGNTYRGGIHINSSQMFDYYSESRDPKTGMLNPIKP